MDMNEPTWRQIIDFGAIGAHQRKHNLTDRQFCSDAGIGLRIFQEVKAKRRKPSDNFIGLVADALGVEHPSQISKWIRR